MRAILCERLGPASALVLADVPSSHAGGRNVKVRVKAASLNFPDTLIIEGKYQAKPELPFSPGSELAGEVVGVGPDVRVLKVGDRVMGRAGPGGAFAEETVVDEAGLTPMPPGMAYEDAAAFTVAFGTGYHALVQRARLASGETLLVLGAGGGVGLAAVALGKVMGARVIAAASTTEKLEAARGAGADDCINYRDEPLKDVLKRRWPDGIDVVFDPVGGALSEVALRRLAWGGRLLVIGFAAGEIPRLPANLALLRERSVVGVFWGAFTLRDPATSRHNMDELVALFSAGRIRPCVSRIFPFEEYIAAFDELTSRRAIGKIVLRIGA